MDYEIVRVLDDRHLIDPESYQRRYTTMDGQGLPSGYYVVMISEVSGRHRYDGLAEYVGPIKDRMHALRLQHRLERDEPAFAHAA